MVYQHHEHWDGSGYPQGLRGQEICEGARVFSVIDAYDAMRCDRCYRAAMPITEAVQEVRDHAGQQFDPQVVEAFLRCQAELDHIIDNAES